jgi:outer membrane immunogenic protein
MKKCVLAGAALAAVAMGSPVLAADLPLKAPPIAPIYNWTGFYVGANAGSSFGQASTDIAFPGLPIVSGYNGVKGALAGVQAGYSWQFNPKWVFGLEADIQAARPRGEYGIAEGPFCTTIGGFPVKFGTMTCTGTTASLEQHIPWFGTARARLGVLPSPEWLLYATGGAAFGEIQNSAAIANITSVTGLIFGVPVGTTTTITAATGSANNNRIGWTVGAGSEVVLRGPWTAKIEYLFVDFGTFSNTYMLAGAPVLTTSTHMIDNIVRIGVNYRFGGPVVAKY